LPASAAICVSERRVDEGFWRELAQRPCVVGARYSRLYILDRPVCLYQAARDGMVLGRRDGVRSAGRSACQGDSIWNDWPGLWTLPVLHGARPSPYNPSDAAGENPLLLWGRALCRRRGGIVSFVGPCGACFVALDSLAPPRQQDEAK